ncbi:hypothetical protein AB4084_23785, partial [Lysobacter sp. 2RAB21]
MSISSASPAADSQLGHALKSRQLVMMGLGSAIGADKKVSAAAASFKPKDTVYASVSTSTSDPAATVATKLGAKWTFQDGQTVHEDPAADV